MSIARSALFTAPRPRPPLQAARAIIEREDEEDENEPWSLSCSLPILELKHFAILCDILVRATDFANHGPLSFLAVLDAYEAVTKSVTLSTTVDARIYTALIALNHSNGHWWRALDAALQEQFGLIRTNDVREIEQRIAMHVRIEQSVKLNGLYQESESIIDEEKHASEAPQHAEQSQRSRSSSISPMRARTVVKSQSQQTDVSLSPVRRRWFEMPESPRILILNRAPVAVPIPRMHHRNRRHLVTQSQPLDEVDSDNNLDSDNVSELLAACFRAWRNYTLKHRTPVELTRLATIYYLDRQWSKWRELTLSTRADHWHCLHVKQRVDYMLQHWQSLTEQRHRAHQLVNYHIAQWYQKRKLRACQTWRECVTTNHTSEQLVGRIQQQRNHNITRIAWQNWRELFLSQCWQRSQSQQAVRHHMQNELRAAIQRWRAKIEHWQRLSHIGSALGDRHTQRFKHQSWLQWRTALQASQAREMSVETSLSLTRARSAFGAWRSFVAQSQRIQRAPPVLYHSILQWHARSFGVASTLLLPADQQARLNAWKLRSLLSAWRSHSLQRQQSRLRLEQHRTRHCIQHWKQRVKISHRNSRAYNQTVAMCQRHGKHQTLVAWRLALQTRHEYERHQIKQSAADRAREVRTNEIAKLFHFQRSVRQAVDALRQHVIHSMFNSCATSLADAHLAKVQLPRAIHHWHTVTTVIRARRATVSVNNTAADALYVSRLMSIILACWRIQTQRKLVLQTWQSRRDLQLLCQSMKCWREFVTDSRAERQLRYEAMAAQKLDDDEHRGLILTKWRMAQYWQQWRSLARDIHLSQLLAQDRQEQLKFRALRAWRFRLHEQQEKRFVSNHRMVALVKTVIACRRQQQLQRTFIVYRVERVFRLSRLRQVFTEWRAIIKQRQSTDITAVEHRRTAVFRQLFGYWRQSWLRLNERFTAQSQLATSHRQHLQAQLVARAIHQWQDFVVYGQRQTKSLAVALYFHHRRLESQSLHLWIQSDRSRKRERQFVQNHCQTRLRRAVQQWQSWSTQHSLQRQSVELANSHARSARRTQSLTQWRRALRRVESLSVIAVELQVKHTRRVVEECFYAWYRRLVRARRVDELDEALTVVWCRNMFVAWRAAVTADRARRRIDAQRQFFDEWRWMARKNRLRRQQQPVTVDSADHDSNSAIYQRRQPAAPITIMPRR